MPSFSHEAILQLFRNQPALATALLRDALHVPLPAHAEVQVVSNDLTEIQPAPYAADLVLLLVRGKPVFAIVVEVQLRKDPRKKYTWPMYAASIRARYQCPSCVLVVTPSESVAKWAGAPYNLGPNQAFAPLVLGPAGVPQITSKDLAIRDPELAVLSTMAHGKSAEASSIAEVALIAASGLDDDTALLYSDLILTSVRQATRKTLEQLMANSEYVFRSNFAIRNQAKGEARGEARGEAKAKIEAVFAVLSVRAMTPSLAAHERISGCQDLALLDRWLRAAVTCTSIDEMLQS
jgi:hypothetical protein